MNPQNLGSGDNKKQRHMKRKEEIIKASEKSVSGYHPAIQKMCTECFIEGAEWSDANPDKRHVYTKRELMDMKFAFNLNGDIVTPAEMRKDLRLLIKHEKAQQLKKAMELLAKIAFKYVETYGSEYEGYNTQGLLEEFQKGLEE